MASTTSSDDPGEVIDMVEFGRDLARRRAEYEARTGAPVPAPRNNGSRRTPEKRALLAIIDKLAAAKGFRW
jgi:hypothetical protein